MFFLLPALAFITETKAAVTGGVIVLAGTIGATVAAGIATIGGITGTAATQVATTIGIRAAITTTLGIIATGGTKALSVGITEAGKSLITSD